MLYQFAKWFAVLGVSVALISEAITYLALLFSSIFWLIADWKQQKMSIPKALATFKGALRMRRWWSLFIVAGLVWIVEGLVAALVQGNEPRVSHLYKAFLILTMVVGYRVLPSFCAVFWRRLMFGALLGAGIAAGAGYMQLNHGGFPMERLLMSKAEKTDKSHYRGQIYVPGTHTKAATGPLRNRIKTSVSLVWFLGLFIGLSSLARTWSLKAALGVVILGLGAFSYFTYAQAGWAASALCLVGLSLVHFVPALRKLLLGTLSLSLVAGMAFVVSTGAGYPSDVAAPVSADKMSVRGFSWAHGLKVIESYPLLGSGLGTYSRASKEFFIDPELAFSHTINTHCQHLTAWAEGGPVGGLAWLSMMVLLIWGIHRSWQSKRSSVDLPFQAQRLAGTFIVVTIFILSFVHDFLFHPSVAALFWMVAGLIGYLAQVEDSPELVNG